MTNEDSFDQGYADLAAEIVRHPYASVPDKCFALISLAMDKAREKHFWGIEPCGMTHGEEKDTP